MKVIKNLPYMKYQDHFKNARLLGDLFNLMYETSGHVSFIIILNIGNMKSLKVDGYCCVISLGEQQKFR